MMVIASVVAGRGRGGGRGRGRSVLLQEQVNIPSTSSTDSYKVNSELFGDIISNPEETHHLVEKNGDIRKQRIGVTPTSTGGSNIQTQNDDLDNVLKSSGTLMTFSSSNSSSDQLSVKSIHSTDPRVSPRSKWQPKPREPMPPGPKHMKSYPISYFLPKYYQPVAPTKRLMKLESSPVKVLKVIDDPDSNRKSIYVAFQDKDSVNRFNCLMEKMGDFYSKPLGFAFYKPAKFLESGEIVAANVSLNLENAVWRRVKVQRVQEGRTLKGTGFQASVIDIDDLSHWNVRTAFSLYKPFYDHPVQACEIHIRNFTDMYPKGIFEALFYEKETLVKVMNELSHKILMSMIGRTIKLSNIMESIMDIDKGMLTAEISLDLNWRLRTLYLEYFKNSYIPRVPKIGTVCYGTITDVLTTDNTIGICLKDSLYKPIDGILNEINLEEIKTPKDKLWTAIKSRTSKQFIGFNDDKSKLCRISVNSYYEEVLRVNYMDTTRETYMNVDELVCSMSDNPNIPEALSLVPPQGIRFQLTNIHKVSPEVCEALYGKNVCFKVSRNSDIGHHLLMVEILDESVQE